MFSRSSLRISKFIHVDVDRRTFQVENNNGSNSDDGETKTMFDDDCNYEA